MSDERPAIAPDEWFKQGILDDPVNAHHNFFSHNHEDADSPAHRRLIEDLWGPERQLIVFGFRGFGKSTRAEEYVALAACLQQFKHCLFLGPSEARAVERLESVKHELENNAFIQGLCPDLRAQPWTETRAMTRSGVAFSAMGVGQKIRGVKVFSARPDLVIIDDYESDEDILTPEARRKMLRWTLRTLRLACHPQARWRILATPMDHDCVPLRLEREAGWPARRYPVSYIDANGSEAAMWPARFPMSWVDQLRGEYKRLGQDDLWSLEMLCDASAAVGERDFRAEHFREEPRQRIWEPVWAACDPARTRGPASASTGLVVFSWVGTELVIWEDRTGFYRPSEIIDHLFQIEEKYHPVAIAFEADGLNEWAQEPIRAEATRRGVFLPLVPVKAPRDRDKFGFIRGLEPHFRNREVVFAGPCAVLKEQLLGFPRGRIDAPNALAYALVVRPGIPVYDNFVPMLHVADHILWPADQPLWLALGATGAYVTGALVGVAFGRTVVLADWLREGDPGAVAADLVGEAQLHARARVSIVAGPEHFAGWSNVGLVQAIRRIPLEIRQGAAPEKGRNHLRGKLAMLVRDVAGFRVDSGARWTLGALAAGYARKPGKPEPEPGIYRTLMESIESLLGVMTLGIADDDVEWSYTATGRRYRRYTSAFERI